ncbi:type VI secretion system membrane subunit TssM [Rubrivivax gelatinosus]|uniref:Type VI secretion system protein ImpL n=2 Tax=Rubrivivax gelatinosus TaxID=28068 RepID=I0HU71_RUBGI|nr:type VI secretion system membrane subunit TssM [Rubrivivax gelatinosus]BAL96558.1 hypothetical protein RGE_32190 [Rubrivivax gelatinosus IL144]
MAAITRIVWRRLAATAAVLLLAAGAGLAVHAAGFGAIAVAAVMAAVLAASALVWMLARRRSLRGAEGLEQALLPPGQDTDHDSGRDALARGLHDAVRRLRASPLGQAHGREALYALPWYVLVGESAAGKSSAVRAAGLGLGPEDTGLHGVGGTRHCDWFFGAEAIVLDTAGRYAVQREDRGEWLAFLDLLRRARPRAPIDGVVVVASAAELATQPADALIALARRLRERVHELGERLAVAMPVYLVFTKLDRVAGFEAFFADAEPGERERVWGATLSCRDAGGADAATRFELACTELEHGLRDRALARLGGSAGPAAPELLGFPLEFAALRPALRSFVATLFDDDPYHLRPLLRGFYFTSAEQPGTAAPRATEAAARRFVLPPPDTAAAGTPASRSASRPFFLAQFFARVLGADRGLVRRQISPRRRRLQRAGYALALVAVAGTLGALSAAYLEERRLVARTATELLQASASQRSAEDLGSRLQALEGLQRQLQALAAEPGLGLGLQQRGALERRLRADYYAGLKVLMLDPVGASLEQDLEARQRASAPDGDTQPAYDTLKAYLMLGDPTHREPVALGEAIARHWRSWLEARRGALPEDELLKRSQAIAAFAVAQAGDPAFPRLEPRAALVDATRRQLRTARQQRPPQERVFDEIRARAAARFAAIGLDTMAGPDAAKAGLQGGTLVSGAFTLEAWRGSIEPAIREAAEGALQRRDWVLDAGTQDDLTLSGSPQQIRQVLAERYRREHAAAWQRFAEGVSVPPFRDLADAVQRLERLADPSASPLARVVSEIARQSALDEPGPAAAPQDGPGGWMRSVWAATTTPASTSASSPDGAASVLAGFAGLQRGGDAAAPLGRYLQALAQVRSRLQTLVRQGDAGPGARAMLAATLADSPESELATALRLTDELLAAVPAGPRATLRPLLLRPLQASAAVLVAPAEAELNRRWMQEVHEPFVRGLSGKYPFDPASRVEAGADEIARIFGPEGSLARYVQTTLGPLVTRRGDGYEALRRGELGIRLRPELARGLPAWQAAAAAVGGPSAGAATAFQIRPLPSAGLVEYTLEIDGQALRYRNAAAGWADFVWPHAGAPAGVRIRGTTADGTTVSFVDAAGSFGLDRAFELAQRTRLPDGGTELAWTQDGHTLRVRLRVVRAADPAAAPGAWRGLRLPALVAGDSSATPGPVNSVAAAMR